MITAEPAAAATRVVMLTTYDLDEYLFESLQAGAVGFLLKGESPENLIRGVRTVAAGDCLLDPSATRKLIAQFVASRPAVSKSRDRRDGDASPTEAAARQQVARLTGREKEVLQLMALGRSNSEIAEELFVGDNTVKTHVSHVLSKLAARDRIQAVIVAYHAGVAEPTQSRRPR
jgi:DNA-binding NarL/FixJ family response regulator